MPNLKNKDPYQILFIGFAIFWAALLITQMIPPLPLIEDIVLVALLEAGTLAAYKANKNPNYQNAVRFTFWLTIQLVGWYYYFVNGRDGLYTTQQSILLGALTVATIGGFVIHPLATLAFSILGTVLILLSALINNLPLNQLEIAIFNSLIFLLLGCGFTFLQLNNNRKIDTLQKQKDQATAESQSKIEAFKEMLQNYTNSQIAVKEANVARQQLETYLTERQQEIENLRQKITDLTQDQTIASLHTLEGKIAKKLNTKINSSDSIFFGLIQNGNGNHPIELRGDLAQQNKNSLKPGRIIRVTGSWESPFDFTSKQNLPRFVADTIQFLDQE